MKTFQPKEKEITRSWHLLNAEDQILGRLSTQIAILLMGKHKATYSTHMDSGDYVVVLNAEKIEVTGKKASQKSYKSSSGYPGGFKDRKYSKVMKMHPERILEHAVSGMIPDNRLKDKRLARLKVIVGDKNPYEKEFKV